MKRSIKQNNRKKLGMIAIVLAVAGLATGVFVTFATSRDNSVIARNIQIATSGVRVIEDSDPGFGKHEITFKNEGTSSAKAVLRIAYTETWTKADGTIVSNTASNSANVVTKNWTTAFVSDFVNGNDGWYYYEKVLGPNEEVKVLSSITLADQSYDKYNYDLSFRFEAIQADSAAILELWNKTATISSQGVVTWAP